MNEMRDKVKSGIEAAADQAKNATDRTASLGGQVKQKAEDVADKAGDIASQVRHKAEDVANKVGGYAHDAKDKVEHWAEDAYEVAGDKLGTLGNDVTDMVKKYPIQALLVGFGVGLLLGRVSRA